MYTYTQDAKASRRSRPARRALFGDSERREENLKKRARSDAVCLDYRQTASSLATRKPLQRGSPFALHGTIAPRPRPRDRCEAPLPMPGNASKNPAKPAVARKTVESGALYRAKTPCFQRFFGSSGGQIATFSITCHRGNVLGPLYDGLPRPSECPPDTERPPVYRSVFTISVPLSATLNSGRYRLPPACIAP